MSRIVEDIRKDLNLNADEKTKKSGENFFKEGGTMYGVKSSITTSIGKEHFNRLSDKSKPAIFGFCDELWHSGYMEESFIACQWSYKVRKLFKPEDFNIFSRWINEHVSNWASCDTFCNHTVGAFIDMYPSFLQDLKLWGISENRWMRRASAVSLIVPARNGRYLKEIFELADTALKDKDDMVQKGYGWMLKVASQAHQKQVFDFVMERKDIMPRTSLRYAIEKMPPDLRVRAMEKPYKT
jgi:3-methyladenine DNA glycosylase AlkD